MESLLVGQVLSIKQKKSNLIKFMRNNKFKLLIVIISISLLISYTILLFQFINLIKML